MNDQEHSGQTPQSAETASETPKKKSGFGKWIAVVLISVVCWAVFDAFAENTAEYMLKNNEHSEYSNYMEYTTPAESIPDDVNAETETVPVESSAEQPLLDNEQIEMYLAGTCDSEGYKSWTQNLKFTPNEHWEMYTQEELDILSAEQKEITYRSVTNDLKGKGFSQDTIDFYLKYTYCAAEMGANYIDDAGYLVGSVDLIVSKAFGTEEVSTEEFVKMSSAAMAASYGNVIESDIQIAGVTRDVLTCNFSQNGLTLKLSCIVWMDDGASYMVRCVYVDGYEEMLDSFAEQTTKLTTDLFGS